MTSTPSTGLNTDLTGTTAIVTGATGGMGRAITARLAHAGAHVIATDLSDADADALLAAAPGVGGSVHFFRPTSSAPT